MKAEFTSLDSIKIITESKEEALLLEQFIHQVTEKNKQVNMADCFVKVEGEGQIVINLEGITHD